MNKKYILIIFVIILLIIILWLTGVIPKSIGKYTALNYVKKNYEEMNLKYNNIEFSKEYGNYIVSFSDKENNLYNLKLNSKYFPTLVIYDSIKQSNVY